MSPEGSTVRSALNLLTSGAGRRVSRADLLCAYTAAREALEADLGRPHPTELEDRHAELIAFLTSPDETASLSHATWVLVLSHLTAEQQCGLQADFEELARGSEAAIEYGENEAGGSEQLMHTLAVLEPLLAELPHTTFASLLGPDDHDLRRRSLSVDIAWADRSGKEAGPGGPVRVVWRDGYDTTIARMGLVLGPPACWMLEITDQGPGRSSDLVLPEGVSDDPAELASSLRTAIRWANRELGDNYIVQGIESQAD